MKDVPCVIVFKNGNKAPSLYRKYNIKESEGKDDLKSMEEVIRENFVISLNDLVYQKNRYKAALSSSTLSVFSHATSSSSLPI